MKVHGDDMVCAGACEQISDQSASLSNPLSVSDLRLESRGFCRWLSYKTTDAVSMTGAIVTVQVCGLIRLIRLARVNSFSTLDTVLFDRAGGIRGTAAALVELHATELVVQSGRAIWQTRTLGLSRMGRLGPGVKGICAGS